MSRDRIALPRILPFMWHHPYEALFAYSHWQWISRLDDRHDLDSRIPLPLPVVAEVTFILLAMRMLVIDIDKSSG